MDTSTDPGTGGPSWAQPPSTVSWPGQGNGTHLEPGLDARPDPTGPGVDEIAVEDTDDLLDLDDARRRPGRVTFVLAAAVIAGLGFTGGAYAQRHVGGTSTGALSGQRSQGAPGGEGAPGGMSAAGIPGGDAMPSGDSSSTSGRSSGTSTEATSTTPVVVGTVTAIGTDTLTVKNLGGTSVVIKVTTGTPITVNGLGTTLKVGTLVSVTGTKATDGSVTAASLAARG
jgi:hypothetical protein